MATYAVLAVEIKKQTDKAVLVTGDQVSTWLPKSQVSVYQINDGQPFAGMFIVELPGWLWYKNRVVFAGADGRAMDIDPANYPQMTQII